MDGFILTHLNNVTPNSLTPGDHIIKLGLVDLYGKGLTTGQALEGPPQLYNGKWAGKSFEIQGKARLLCHANLWQVEVVAI